MPVKITSIINRLTRTIHCLQFSHGLNPAQWEALRFLARANRYSRNPSALAEYLRTTKGTASQTLKALEGKGFVRRIAVPHDRRAVRLDLSEQGQAVLERDPLRDLEASAAGLGPDLDAVGKALAALVGGLERRAGLKGFGLCRECTHFCKNAAAAAQGGPHQCGLNRDALSAQDSEKICVDHLPLTGAPVRA